MTQTDSVQEIVIMTMMIDRSVHGAAACSMLGRWVLPDEVAPTVKSSAAHKEMIRHMENLTRRSVPWVDEDLCKVQQRQQRPRRPLQSQVDDS